LDGANKSINLLPTLLRPIEANVQKFIKFARKHRRQKSGPNFWPPAPGEAKLGGAALSLLTMLKRRQLHGTVSGDATISSLARFTLAQQQATGRFESLFFPSGHNLRKFESTYYPAQAVLALVRFSKTFGNLTRLRLRPTRRVEKVLGQGKPC
jgi:hypothetical protein